MVYPGSFHRIVASGTLYGVEQFSYSMSVIPAVEGLLPLGASNQALVDDLAVFFQNLHNASAGAIGFSNQCALTSLKVNRIGPDGKYADPETFEHVYASPISGGNATRGPAQIAAAVSLTTAVPRGLASKGRFYLPAPVGWYELDSTGRASTASATSLAAAAVLLIDSINARYVTEQGGSDASTGAVGVASNVGSGTFRVATGVRVGRVPDTIRSRRGQISEEYVADAIGA